MSYRMPFPVPFLPLLLIATFAGGISIWAIKLFSSAKIRETQTHFSIRQATELLDQIDDANFPRTTAGLIDRLRSSGIDWNSCGIRGEQVLDGWGNPITTTFDHKGGIWSFHSFGKDGKSGTADDIYTATIRKRKSEQAGTSKGG
jgi:hypothetical protein